MKVTATQEGSVTIVAIEGKIDTDTCDDVEAALLAHINKGAKRLVIDLADVTYVSSAGLRAVLIVGKKIKSLQGKMAFCTLRPVIWDVFEASGFTSILTVCETRDGALAFCQG
ncbi:STAS domain-containing protein [Pararhodospirillum oryzae]|uniref:Anti-sigma factor antagonist n=1 Tax=Pararhodospirillum oryzae TaxID=478448 RepID=A0A512HA21_9PROT|nr:STAS domain-containing protein [Pararhodospirillum oryzae]GEO82303.1 anti-sigma factor antagonist [Pararhodospirillum oryzae]